jgi:hypothetical protein
MAVRKRTAVALAAGVLVAPLLPFAASPALAVGEDTPPPPRSVAEFCQNVPEDYQPFTDIAGNTFEDNIECLAAAEITQGGPGELSDDQYGPGLPVRRDAMASFIARLIDKADELDTGDNIRTLPPFDGEVTPTDVSPSSVHAQSIDRLFEAGVVAGGPGGRPRTEYGPSLEVTRAQMASFIRNALQFSTNEDITSDQDFFTDDENATPHEPRINAVAERAIAVGDGRDTYNPFRTVSRDQMSGFLTRTLALLEERGDITPLPFGDEEVPATAVTEAPDLIGAEVLDGTATATATTVVFTFDEEVVAGDAVDPAAFHVYGFDGEQFTGETATRDTDDTSSVRVEFALDAERAAELTLATVDAAAVEDADENTNPIGDAPLGEGVSLTAGRTTAPDLIGISGFQTATPSGTTVDFTFDQEAFVVDPAPGQFQLVLADGTDVEGAPVEDEEGNIAGDGTDTITVQFEGTVDPDEVGRGVVLQGTVSDEEQVQNGSPLTGDPVEGAVNPLQVTDADFGGTTTVPDLVSATVDAEASEVTYTFDENVAVEDAALFHVYDSNGEQLDGAEAAERDIDGDRTVVITFAAGELDAVVGASVDEGAVTQTASGARANQEDEVAVAAPSFAAGVTVGPDLVEVTRESVEDGIVVRFTFDDEATTPQRNSFFVVSETGEQTPLTNCTQSETAGEENVVECFATSSDNPLTPTVDESEAFTAAGEAVLGTVDDGAVTDDEGDANPEGAAVLEDA